MPTPKGLKTWEFAEAVGCKPIQVSVWVSKGLLRASGRDGKHVLYLETEIQRMRDLHHKARTASDPPIPSNTEINLRFGTSLPEEDVAPPSKVESALSASLAEAPSASDEQLDNVLPFTHLNHRRPVTTTPRGVPTRLPMFGPIELTTIVDNTDEGASMVPEVDRHFELDVAEAIVIANALKNNEPTWIWGPSGAGKTDGITQMCALVGWPLYRVNMHGDFKIEDFVGTTEVVIDAGSGVARTQFKDGVLVRALLNGGLLLVDEFTACPPHILIALQAVLEAVGRREVKFVNTANGGEVIHGHPRFRMIVADNTNGQGDVTGAYAGAGNTMNEATRSRFTQWLRKGYPDRATWKKILRAKALVDDSTATKILDAAEEINKGSALLGMTPVTCNIAINVRDTLAVARLSRVYGDLGIAFRVGLLDSMNNDDADRRFVVDLLKNKLGLAVGT